MDRRGFLRVLGVGGALVAAAPMLIVPAARNVVAEPERRIFLPPASGWPSAGPGMRVDGVELVAGQRATFFFDTTEHWKEYGIYVPNFPVRWSPEEGVMEEVYRQIAESVSEAWRLAMQYPPALAPHL